VDGISELVGIAAGKLISKPIPDLGGQIGFKGTTADMSCRNMTYQLGKQYSMRGTLMPCLQGFHFCKKLSDVTSYYDDYADRYFKVVTDGKVVDEGSKSVTNRIRFIKELDPWDILEQLLLESGKLTEYPARHSTAMKKFFVGNDSNKRELSAAFRFMPLKGRTLFGRLLGIDLRGI
jgi:hypothetical protein